ncbi:hypothetical protein RA307_08630 [Xanthobacteraceae bacterium Astr-EGSB]|nr:hypothetical protein [Xanthobacteraceae bacterium Astr-EGSB]
MSARIAGAACAPACFAKEADAVVGISSGAITTPAEIDAAFAVV